MTLNDLERGVIALILKKGRRNLGILPSKTYSRKIDYF